MKTTAEQEAERRKERTEKAKKFQALTKQIFDKVTMPCNPMGGRRLLCLPPPGNQKESHQCSASYLLVVCCLLHKTAFTRCRHILKTVKNVTVAEFELAFTRCRNNLKTVGNLTVRNSLQDFDAIERYLHPNCRSVLFQKRRKRFYFQHYQVFTQCRFQKVPVRVQFSKSTVFKMCWQKMCRFRVNGRPIHHIFHRFQNVLASCERSLIFARISTASDHYTPCFFAIILH